MAYIAPLPTPPQRSDPDNFAVRADAFLGALPQFGADIDAIYPDIALCANDINAVRQAPGAATTALAAQTAAVAAANSASASASSASASAATAAQAVDAAAAIVYTQPLVMAPNTITQNVTIPDGYNAVLIGAVTIADGVTIMGLGSATLVGI